MEVLDGKEFDRSYNNTQIFDDDNTAHFDNINDEAMERNNLITQIDEMHQSGDIQGIQEMQDQVDRIDRRVENEKIKVSKTIVMLLKREYRQNGLDPFGDAIKEATKKLYRRIRITSNDIMFDKGDGVQRSLLENGKWYSPKDYGKVLGKEFMEKMNFDTSMDSLNETKKTLSKLGRQLNQLKYWRSIYDEIKPKETIEMIDVTKKNVDVAIQTLEQQSFKRDDGVLVPMRELRGLDQAMTKIKGNIELAVANGLDYKTDLEKENRKLQEIKDSKDYTDLQKLDLREKTEARIKELKHRIELNDEIIDDLKGNFRDQISHIKDSLSRFMDKDEGTLAERIKNLFREQGITIVSVLTAFGMAIGVLVEALLPGAKNKETSTGKGKKKTNGWISNKLKALANLLGRLADKSKALPGIIGSIISFILSRIKDVFGWLSENVWALVVGIGMLIYVKVPQK